MANTGTAISSSASQVDRPARTFAAKSAVPSTGASRTMSKPPCSRSATKTRLIARIAANRTSSAERPRRGALEPLAVEPEPEEDEGGRGEQRHRRHGLERPQLDAQVLARIARKAFSARPARSRARPPATGGRRPRVGDDPVGPEGSTWSALDQAGLDLVGDDDPGSARLRAEQLVDDHAGGRGRGAIAARRAAAGRARAGAPGRSPRAGASPAGEVADQLALAACQPGASRSAAIRASGRSIPCRRALNSRFSRTVSSR